MRVLQINAVYEFSSTGRTTKEMHEALLQRGIASYVFCSDKADIAHGIYQIGNKFDHLIHGLLSRVFGLQGYFSYTPTKWMIKRLKGINPDVVVLRNLHANYVDVNKLLCYLGDNHIKTVVVLHDCWFFTGHCCYYYEDKCYKWEKECHNCPILHKYNKSLFFDKSRKIFTDKANSFGKIGDLTVVGVSKWVANEAKRSPIFKNAKILHKYNWIDLDIFKPHTSNELREKNGIANNSFVAISVSSVWEKKKGLYKILSIANKLTDVVFVLVGRLEDVSLPNNVISVGPVFSQIELAKYYSMADVYLNFSIQETFGKVSAEALSCGTPVIAHNSTANPELVGNGCGLVIDTECEEQIEEAILRIREWDKSTVQQTCRCFALDNFSKDTIIGSYINEIFKQTE